MTDAFDPIEANQRATALLTSRVRDALGGAARDWIKDVERRGGTLQLSGWPNGELSVSVTQGGETLAVFWIVTRRGVSIFLDGPPVAAPDRVAPSNEAE
ncbi:hypothetical protein C7401_13710 [Paraburkholderia unamae]|uniref:hypothetical protein n=1 Tax=Paraburkholderia unamae TaxID=219649 RepID=UPI000DC4B4F2|nr:hypothetical protein [Paraburkholderia unamae]RAR51470.1 hypothetical protein C7401_13710 [Paraburkholderia unamae]